MTNRHKVNCAHMRRMKAEERERAASWAKMTIAAKIAQVEEHKDHFGIYQTPRLIEKIKQGLL